MRIVVVALALLLPGCLDQVPESEAEFVVSGTFTEGATPEDVAEAHRLAEGAGGELFVMESFPLQFQASNFGAAACERFRVAMLEREYVAQIGDCRARIEVEDPAEPTTDAA